MEGKVETNAIESKSDESDSDMLEDLEDMLLGGDVEIISLMDMYNQTFQGKGELGEFTYDSKTIIAQFNPAFKKKKKFLKENGKYKELKNYVNTIINDYEKGNSSGWQGRLYNMIQKDFKRSPWGAEEYKKEAKNYRDYAARLLMSWVADEGDDMVVDMDKKGRLLRILTMAIKIGLNYQMLDKFDVKFLPPIQDINGVPAVKVSDLDKSPYWENIRVDADMGEYVSEAALRQNTNELVNTVKRTTLYRIHKVSQDYRLDLDSATPNQLKQLCLLKTLELAPDVHADACRHFDRGTGRMEDKYTEWLEKRSFKPYSKEVDDDVFITVPELDYPPETTVNDVLNDLSLLPGLIRYRNHDDHENEIKKNGELFLVDAPSDAAFARELSNAFVELGFLPEGYERYCGVKVGEVRPKRSVDGTTSPAKRPRSKLFTQIEIH